jgi:hypothetical protein
LGRPRVILGKKKKKKKKVNPESFNAKSPIPSLCNDGIGVKIWLI